MFLGGNYLIVIRVLRLLRVFRILKLVRYSSEAGVLITSLLRSRHKIFVFICALLTVVTIFGSLMYVIEGPEHGFTSIPTGMYWAVVTMATVGYGDISPGTGFGRLVTSVLILIGYSVIAVPTGIFTAELAKQAPAAQAGPMRGAPAVPKQMPNMRSVQASPATVSPCRRKACVMIRSPSAHPDRTATETLPSTPRRYDVKPVRRRTSTWHHLSGMDSGERIAVRIPARGKPTNDGCARRLPPGGRRQRVDLCLSMAAVLPCWSRCHPATPRVAGCC